MERIEIPLSKIRIMLIVLASLMFILLGFLLLDDDIGWHGRHTALRKPVGIAAIIVFGIFGIAAFAKLFSIKKGFIIDRKGITDNSGIASFGFIPWSDIQQFKINQARSQKQILVYVNHPEERISGYSFFAGIFMKISYKFCGAPFSVSHVMLKCEFDTLYNLLQKYLGYYKER
jgi:hypothetical protein